MPAPAPAPDQSAARAAALARARASAFAVSGAAGVPLVHGGGAGVRAAASSWLREGGNASLPLSCVSVAVPVGSRMPGRLPPAAESSRSLRSFCRFQERTW